MKKLIWILGIGGVILMVGAFLLGRYAFPNDGLKELPKPEFAEGQRGELGIDKNVNEASIDAYLGRSDAVYRDLRMLDDPGNYEAIGGDAKLSGFVRGFEVVPFPYIVNVTGLPEAVGDTYKGKTLFSYDGTEYKANYKESMEILEGLFTKYPNISADLTPGTMFWEFDKHRAYFKDFLEKHAHRLIYGSDSFVPGNPDSENLIVDVYRWIATKERACVWGYEMEGLALSEEACEKILYQNFLVRNPQPQKADKEAMKRYWDMYGHLIVRQTNKTQIAAFLEK